MRAAKVGLRWVLFVVGAALLAAALVLLLVDRLVPVELPSGSGAGGVGRGMDAASLIASATEILFQLRVLLAPIGASLVGAGVIVGIFERHRFESDLPYELSEHDHPPRLLVA